MTILIVGLGNPGNQYLDTRHNIGFKLIDYIAKSLNITMKYNNKFDADIAITNIKSNLLFDIKALEPLTQKAKLNTLEQEIILLKPQTFMNLSGKSVLAVSTFYKIKPADILVIHDELDFEISINKLKYSGGNNGHNGLKSITNMLGADYWRLRLGIGRPIINNMDVAAYVLSKFTEPQFDDISATFKKLYYGILLLIFKQDANALKYINTKL